MITVIIPILNAMPYLPEALASLEAQTFRDFEVCLWDNGSTDRSVEEARRWIPGRLKGRVVTGNPLPLHECLARMVEEAQTEFVARMDGDDVCVPGRFERQIAAMLKNPEIGIVGGQCIYIGSDGKQLRDQEVLPMRHEDILTQMLFRSALTHPALLFRRAAILEAGNYHLPKPIEDFDLYLKMARACKLTNLTEAVLKYRIHPESVSRLESERQQKLMVDVVASQSKEIYGLEREKYLRLRNRQSPCAIFELYQSAQFRSHRFGGRASSIFRSRYFINNGRCLCGKYDILSKIAFRILECIPKTQFL